MLSEVVERKKQGFRKKLRRQWLEGYFKVNRDKMLREEGEEWEFRQELSSAIKGLPNTVERVGELLKERRDVGTEMLVEQVRELAHVMCQLDFWEWEGWVRVLCQLLMTGISRENLQRVIKATTLPVLQNGQMLEHKLHKSGPLYRRILSGCLQFCFRLGQLTAGLNFLQVRTVSRVLRILWLQQQIDSQYQLRLLLTCNNILSSQFDPQQLQNIKKAQAHQLMLSKVELINTIFYAQDHKILSIVVQRFLQAHLKRQDDRIQELYLRLLVNITYYTNSSIYLRPLLGQNVLSAVQGILLDPHAEHQPAIFTMRLINNLLVTDTSLTPILLQEIILSQVIAFSSSYPDHHQVREETIDCLVNIIHFMNDNPLVIRKLVDYQVPQAILQELQQEKDEYRALQMLSALTIMSRQSKIKMRAVLVEWIQVVEFWAGIGMCNKTAEELLLIEGVSPIQEISPL